MVPHNQPRPTLTQFKPPLSLQDQGYSKENPLEVDMTIEDETIDVWFKEYILNESNVQTHYYYATQENINDFLLAYENLQSQGVNFTTGDYLITTNNKHTKYAIYLRTPDDWVAFNGKSAYDTEPGDVTIVIDDDDEEEIGSI